MQARSDCFSFWASGWKLRLLEAGRILWLHDGPPAEACVTHFHQGDTLAGHGGLWEPGPLFSCEEPVYRKLAVTLHCPQGQKCDDRDKDPQPNRPLCSKW